ncbi:MAG: FMN-dependent NADH-azoreductase AzoR1 [Pleurocapsa sp.]
MTNLLHLDSSPRGDRSVSRQLTHKFVTAWQEAQPDTKVTYRDLGHQIIPPVDEPWIAAAFSPPEATTLEMKSALKISDELIDELLAADYYVLGVPMYNFNIPSNLKAYIDQVVRVRRTFIVNEQGGYEGLVRDKKMLVITARGGAYTPNTPYAQYDFQEPYLRAIFGTIGITDITFIHGDNLSSGAEARQESLDKAVTAIAQTVSDWS